MKNGRKAAVFIGVAGIAVVLVVLYSTSSPPFVGTDATGAIGSVEKHREQQIAPEDVILSDEATHEATKALFADYLEDAVKLENVVVELQAVLRGRDNQIDSNHKGHIVILSALRTQLEAIDRLLAAHENAIAARALGRATSGVGTMEQMLAARADADFSALQARLRNLKQDLQARRFLSAADVGALQPMLGAIEGDFEAALEARRLADLQASLESARRALVAGDAQLEARLRSAENDLKSFKQALELRRSLDARHEWAPSSYLAAIARQQLAIQSGRQHLAAALAASSGTPFAKLAAAESVFSDEAQALEASALDRLNAHMESRMRYASGLRSLNASLGDFAQQIEARPQIAARMPEFDTHLAVALRAVSDLDAAMAARDLRQLNAELSFVSSYLDQRSSLAARMGGAEDEALQARANVLRARTADTFDAYFAAVGRQLASRSFDAQYANSRSNLANRAEQLRSHAAMVAARSR